MSDDVIVTTTNDLPGYDVVVVHGEVFGLIVRSRNAFHDMRVAVRTFGGGEVKAHTKAAAESRGLAVERLKDAARARGANAVLAMRFDCADVGNTTSEVAAYGTAVTVRRAA